LIEAFHLWHKLGNEKGIAFSLVARGTNAQNRSDYPGAEALEEEGLAVARRAEDRVDTYWALHMLARLAIRRRDYSRAQALIDEGLPPGSCVRMSSWRFQTFPIGLSLTR
jgi:hypothetical protein